MALLALPLEDEARGQEQPGRELAPQRAEEVVPRVARGARADPLERLLLEAAAEEVLARLRARGRPEGAREVLGRRLHEREHLLALLAVGPGLDAALGHRTPKRRASDLDRLGEAHPLAEHQELEDVAALAAAEAVEDGRLLPHVEGRASSPGGTGTGPSTTSPIFRSATCSEITRTMSARGAPPRRSCPGRPSLVLQLHDGRPAAALARPAEPPGGDEGMALEQLAPRPSGACPAPKPWTRRISRRSESAASSSSLSTRWHGLVDREADEVHLGGDAARGRWAPLAPQARTAGPMPSPLAEPRPGRRASADELGPRHAQALAGDRDLGLARPGAPSPRR